MPWFIPPLIFLARICDVSIGTLRIMTVVRGRKMLAATLGFFEVIIWVLAVSGVLRYIGESPLALIAYGLGFAAGTLIGIWLEQRLALGLQIVRAINPDEERPLADALRAEGLKVTEVAAKGAVSQVEVCFLVAARRKVREIVDKILRISPRAFLTTEDIREASSFIGRLERSRSPGWLKLVKFK